MYLNRSSGIQILPAIQPEVNKVVTFIRGATWISPVQGLDQHHYTEEERRLFRNEPSQLTAYRKMNETSMNCLFGTFIKGSGTQIDTRVDLTEKMQTKLSGTGLESKLIPQWSPGCRRLTPGINYLEALSQPNVQVVTGEISRITETGCIDKNDVLYQLDVLICATGFDVSFKPRFPIVGLTGDLQDQWAKEAKSYLGTAAAGVPNYMVFLGPNCPIGNGPVLRVIGKKTLIRYWRSSPDPSQRSRPITCYTGSIVGRRRTSAASLPKWPRWMTLWRTSTTI